MKKYVGEITWKDIINETELYKNIENIDITQRIEFYKKHNIYKKYADELKLSYKEDIQNNINVMNKHQDLYKYKYWVYFNRDKDFKCVIRDAIANYFGPWCDKDDLRFYAFIREMIMPFVCWTNEELEELDNIMIDMITCDWNDENEENY